MTAERARAIGANEMGQVLVVMYHLIDSEESEWTHTPEDLRKDIALLKSEGYYPINVRDLASGNIDIPAGKSPVVITFDDSSPGQYRILDDGTVDIPHNLRAVAQTIGNQIDVEVRRQLQQLSSGAIDCLKITGAFPEILEYDPAGRGDALIESPKKFAPIPDPVWHRAAAAAAGLAHAAELDIVSYHCENAGAPFVNLVPDDDSSEEDDENPSIKQLNGHTDGSFLPFPAHHLSMDPEKQAATAPAPDFVILIGLRNPEGVETRFLPFQAVLDTLSRLKFDDPTTMLMEPRYLMTIQPSFDVKFAVNSVSTGYS